MLIILVSLSLYPNPYQANWANGCLYFHLYLLFSSSLTRKPIEGLIFCTQRCLFNLFGLVTMVDCDPNMTCPNILEGRKLNRFNCQLVLRRVTSHNWKKWSETVVTMTMRSTTMLIRMQEPSSVRVKYVLIDTPR